MAIVPIPPAFPVPVLPQSFDTSLSYYELLCKLTEGINACIEQVNALSAVVANLSVSVSGFDEQITEIRGLITAEAETRQQQINSLAGDLANFKNTVIMTYATYDDIESDYIINATVQAISQSDYEALDNPVQNRIYAVIGENGTVLYFNGAPLMGGQAAGNIQLNMQGNRAFLFGDLET